MSLAGLGEFGFIAQVRRKLKTDRTVAVGSGDDCAAVEYDRRRYLLLTCDLLVEDVDFRRRDDPALIGRKAVAVSLSDIAACGGVPKWALVSLGLPRGIPLAYARTLAAGMIRVADRYSLRIVGGDMSRSDKIVIDVSMAGLVEKKRLALRSGARPGDVIMVTGSVGGSIRGKHLTFTPRVKESRQLVTRYRVHSMIDISDGLAQDLGHIARQSGVGAVLYGERIPLARGGGSLEEALCAGEDFELLFTVSAREAERIARDRTVNARAIGEIVEKRRGMSLVGASGKVRRLLARGYRHF